ncbi:hypothetical protein HanRHA438_Chr02g0065911 [Helianthus annuus]|uniref:Uncharacterized protein n=1 Tax=Helianthus annuus TaxID=4232 RepID=A0A9K3NYW2_HELAN|nr:hypothetical protein HanXRQr2_Chr02g0064641 [Helianthus annuus]KAJ0939846.1 hypothetical protein HanRHA438_Chr02g0065911 [Helianthus annuus]
MRSITSFIWQLDVEGTKGSTDLNKGSTDLLENGRNQEIYFITWQKKDKAQEKTL